MTTALELLRGCLKPGLTMAALLFGTATLAGWAAADLATPLAAAGCGVLVGVAGLLAHEGAHLWLARRLGGPDAARLRTSWRGLSVDAPGLHPQHSAAVALVGPLAGAARVSPRRCGRARQTLRRAFSFGHELGMLVA